MDVEVEVDEYDRRLPDLPGLPSIKNVNEIKDQTIDQLISQNSQDGKRVHHKAVALNVLNKFIRFLSIGSTLIIGILGINLIANPNDKASAIAVTILGFTATFTLQVDSEFNFRERSNVLYGCYKKYNEANDILIKLRLSDDSPLVILNKAQRLKKRMKTVDLAEFDSSIIEFDPEYRLSKTASIGISEAKNRIEHFNNDYHY